MAQPISSEQGSESKVDTTNHQNKVQDLNLSDTNKPSEQGSGLNYQTQKHQNKVQDSKPSEIDPIQNDTTNNQTPKIPNTVGDLFKELRKIRDQYYRFKGKLDSVRLIKKN
nr:hypothetical protein [Mycoplasmopsis bovis]